MSLPEVVCFGKFYFSHFQKNTTGKIDLFTAYNWQGPVSQRMLDLVSLTLSHGLKYEAFVFDKSWA